MSASPRIHDVVIAGGRVVDPANNVDAVTDVAIDRDRIAAIRPGLAGRDVVDAAGCVVAPGFIDMHSHAQDLDGHRLQAMDGVSTSLDLESGVGPVDQAYSLAARDGRPLNYGYSAPWAAARMQVLGGVSADGTFASMLSHIGDSSWQLPATPHEVDRIIAVLRSGLDDGALGIGVLLGYAQASSPAEYLAVATLAAERGVPTFTHARDLVEISPEVVIDGAEEIVRAAAETGAQMHYCHVNSTSLRHVDRVLRLVDAAQREGSTVTTEAYPYGAAMTAIGAQFLAPDVLAAQGIKPTSLRYAPTGERVADNARLAQLRAEDPGGLVMADFLDEEVHADMDILLRSLTFPGACVASDAMPLTWRGGAHPGVWPLPPSGFTHPRSAGTFARFFRLTVTERGVLDINEFIRRASVLPAAIVAAATGQRVRKGTLGVGADADVVVLDPLNYCDQATYEASTRPSGGVRHLLVGGVAVVSSGELVRDALPGRAVRATG